jgi:hypothetical protein
MKTGTVFQDLEALNFVPTIVTGSRRVAILLSPLLRSEAPLPPAEALFQSRTQTLTASVSRDVRRGEDGRRQGLAVKPYHVPVFGMLSHGSLGLSGEPFCKSSTEMPSGERMKAMLPSRGGRLIVTPLSIKRWQTA